jgi:glycosyltransferase involved in cell wall biosynthesis
MPAYNAAATLKRTYDEVMAQGIVDLVVVVDDASRDETAAIARTLPRAIVHRHPVNRGYGANQKTCYRLALRAGADVVVMVHPDYQYTPRLIPAMVSLITSGLYKCVLGSRILGGRAVRCGMPRWKYVGNRLLTLAENLLLGAKLSEYHTGYRAFARGLLERLPLDDCADDFVFDNQVLAQIQWLGEPIAEVTCPARYEAESSSIGFLRSVVYGLGCLRAAAAFRLAKWKLVSPPGFLAGTQRTDVVPRKSRWRGRVSSPTAACHPLGGRADRWNSGPVVADALVSRCAIHRELEADLAQRRPR